MYELDAQAIPTGRLVDPPEGPWDNCFTALQSAPTLDWAGALRLRLGSSADHWVIYDEPEHAICVEPQTAAPDAFNRTPQVVEAGASMHAEFWLAWG
jgi:aldose 1-epimerase